MSLGQIALAGVAAAGAAAAVAAAAAFKPFPFEDEQTSSRMGREEMKMIFSSICLRAAATFELRNVTFFPLNASKLLFVS